jgi:hypothetical protein
LADSRAWEDDMGFLKLDLVGNPPTIWRATSKFEVKIEGTPLKKGTMDTLSFPHFS